MSERIEAGGLSVAKELHDFVVDEALSGTGLEAETFWEGFGVLLRDLMPRNAELLAVREEMQQKIDGWLRENDVHDLGAYKAFLRDNGYLVKEGPDFSVATENVDPEIASTPGPQLVVPVLNARYALNAANARWGSLYDALYGTDAMGSTPPAGGYSDERGAEVIAWARGFLDRTFPLRDGSWSDVDGLSVEGGVLFPTLKDVGQFAGYRGDAGSPSSVLLMNNELHADILIDRENRIGRTDQAGISDVILESALTSIMDNEDSIAAVDAEDKAAAYRNWLGLMRGDLEDTFEKGGKSVTRRLNGPREYRAADGSGLSLKGQVLMLTRNVGHLMRNPAIPRGRRGGVRGVDGRGRHGAVRDARRAPSAA